MQTDPSPAPSIAAPPCAWHALPAEQALAEPIDTDDRAMALARLAQVRDALGESAVATMHRTESRRLHTQHVAQQQRTVALLDEALAGLDPKLL